MTARGPRSAKRHRAALIAVRVCLVSLALLPFAPFLLAGLPGGAVLVRVCEHWFAFQCQRDPRRALRILGYTLPVCARCSGIYWGLGLGALIGRPELNATALRTWIAIASACMVCDVLSEALGVRPPWAPLRVFSGLLLAYPVGVALLGAARARLAGAPSSEAVLDAD